MSSSSYTQVSRTISALISQLSDDLLHKSFRSKKGHWCRVAGHCYILSEALYHLGLKDEGFKPAQIQHEGVSHWFLRHRDGAIVDPSWRQFNNDPPYALAKGRGFLTKQPSKRTQLLIDRYKESI